MTPSRLLALLLAVLVLAPANAFAQGAGDDQYQDPFPEAQAQEQPDDGLSDEPPMSGSDGSGSGGDGGSSGSSGGGSGSSGEAPADPATAPVAEAAPQLPRTGSEPGHLVLAGLAFLLIGAGLRLRTIDPDAY